MSGKNKNASPKESITNYRFFGLKKQGEKNIGAGVKLVMEPYGRWAGGFFLLQSSSTLAL
jgi:hypothetical protein